MCVSDHEHVYMIICVHDHVHSQVHECVREPSGQCMCVQEYLSVCTCACTWAGGHMRVLPAQCHPFLLASCQARLVFLVAPCDGTLAGGGVCPSLNRGLEQGQSWAVRHVLARAIAPSACGANGPLVALGMQWDPCWDIRWWQRGCASPVFSWCWGLPCL